MKIREIIKDALRYPLSDWRKLLFLGIIIWFSGIVNIAMDYTTDYPVLRILFGAGFLVGFLANGYLFKILKSSLHGAKELPEFNAWTTMLIDGFKVFIVFIVYLILPVLALIQLNPPTFFAGQVMPDVSLEILSFPWLAFGGWPEIMIAPLFIYTILIIPAFLLAISNMAYYKGEFRSAFGFREIFDDIVSIGWIKLIKWYIATGIIFWALILMSVEISLIFSRIQPGTIVFILEQVALVLIIMPYAYMFLTRSLALVYKQE